METFSNVVNLTWKMVMAKIPAVMLWFVVNYKDDELSPLNDIISGIFKSRKATIWSKSDIILETDSIADK